MECSPINNFSAQSFLPPTMIVFNHNKGKLDNLKLATSWICALFHKCLFLSQHIYTQPFVGSKAASTFFDLLARQLLALACMARPKLLCSLEGLNSLCLTLSAGYL